MSGGGGAVRHGTVEEFDEAVGLGVVAGGPGGSGGGSGGAVGSGGGAPSSAGRYPFHCTQIAGGSRTIEVGTEVTFTVVAGRLGRWEAAEVAPVIQNVQ